MARRIDKISLFLLLLVLGLLFFRMATGGLTLALPLTFVYFCALRGAFVGYEKKFGAKRREKRRRERAARALLDQWALAPDEASARAFFGSVYPNDPEARILLVPLHAREKALDVSRLIRLYRENRDAVRLALLVTGAVESAAIQVAAGLARPRVAVIDGERLAQILCKSELPLKDAPKPGRRAFALPRPNKKRAPYCALYALFMLGAYLLTGNPLLLISALGLLFFAGIGLKKPEAPEKMFQDP